MSRMVCPDCGSFVGPARPGKAAFCPRCMRPVEMPDAADADFWSNSLSEWEAAIADAPREPAAAPGKRRPAEPRDAYRIAIYAMFALVAFLIALVGAVLAARSLRPLVARNHPESTPALPATPQLEPSLHQLEAASDHNARLEAAKKVVALGPAAVAAALDRFTSAGGDGDLPSISQPIVHALAEVGPAAADALGQALGSPKARVRAAAADVLAEMGAGQRGQEGAAGRAGRQERLGAVVFDRGPGQHGGRGGLGGRCPGAVAGAPGRPDALLRDRSPGTIGPPAKSAAAALQKLPA